MNNITPPQNAESYITLVRQLAAITNNAMDYIQSNPPVYLESLDRIAHNVETIACLRGDSGIYTTTRPEGLINHQNEMYEIENQLRARLISLGYKYPTSRSLSEII